jgi:hypothetical protein
VFRDVVMDVAAVGAAATLNHVVAAPGFPEAALGDSVDVSCAALEADLGIVNAFVHVAGGFTVTFMNPTAAPINPASHTYQVLLTKKGPTL